MKVLIVDPDARRGPELQRVLAAEGMDVTVATSGSFALTMLEWNRHDVVLSRARIADMEGHELCAILRSDPGTRHVRFLLVAAADEIRTAQTIAAGVDLVVPAALPAEAMAPLVQHHVPGDSPTRALTTSPAPAAALESAPGPAPDARAGLAAPLAPSGPIAPPPAAPPAVPRLRPDPVAVPVTQPPVRYVTAAAAAAAAPWTKTAAPPAAPPVAPASVPPPPVDLDAVPSGTFQGSLEVMDLAGLAQAIAMGNKNGRLILALPHAGGVVTFEAGRIVHAEYRGAVGEAAFAALLTAASAGPGRFCFLPRAAGEKVSPTRTIDKNVDQLLLSIATTIDQKG